MEMKFINFRDSLNAEQLEAVETTEGSVLVLAGAGTGKTRVITYRIAYMIQEVGIPSFNIMAVTFTNKAALEMKHRLVELMGYNAAGAVWVATFHSACLHLLKGLHDSVGLAHNFSIVDQDDRLSLVRDAVQQCGHSIKEIRPKGLMHKISSFKNTMGFVNGEKPAFTPDELQIFETYQSILERQQLIDFDDMMPLVIRAFRNPEVFDTYKEAFRYILVDEYQDTNTVQFHLLELLSEPSGNICVVGDDDQSIYGFRGAVVENILHFDSIFQNTKVIKLVQNYRSCAPILKAANALISNNKSRRGKELVPHRKESGSVAVCPQVSDTLEASFVATTVERLHNEGVEYDQMAVLYRTNSQSRNFELMFNREGIPYKVIGSVGFYQRREIKDVLAYLRFAANPMDEVSFERALKSVPRGVGNVTIARLRTYAQEAGVSLVDSMANALDTGVVKSKAAVSLNKFMVMMEGIIAKANKPSQGLQIVLDKSTYREHVLNFAQTNEEATARLANLDELYNSAVAFEEENEHGGLGDFLAHTAIQSSSDEANTDNVSFMTIHSAKGLEFHTVFLTGLETSLFPLHDDDDNQDEIEEERRLAYVGITRAKDNLFLTMAASRMRHGQRQNTVPSRFISEAGQGYANVASAAFQHRKTYGDTSGKPKGRNAVGPAKPTVARVAGAENVNGLRVNDNVKHNVFGEGKVITLGEGIATVLFQISGLKKVLVGYLTPVEKTVPQEKTVHQGQTHGYDDGSHDDGSHDDGSHDDGSHDHDHDDGYDEEW